MLIAQLLDDLRIPSRSWAFVPFRVAYIIVALICSASSALAVAQLFGWHPLPEWPNGHQPGLFYNTIVQGAAISLCIILLIIHRLWLYIPALLPGLYLAHSRGAWAALAVGLVALTRRPLLILILALSFSILYSYHPNSSDLQRLLIWHAAYTHLSFWGNGFGSFMNLWIGDPAWQPQYVHNDYLELVFDWGIFAAIPFAAIAWLASRTSARDWPAFAVLLFLAAFSMPMHMHIVVAIGLLVLASIVTESLGA